MYQRLFHSMMEAFALHEVVAGMDGQPQDFRFLEVNREFERLTGLDRESIIGRTVMELFPNIDPNWLRGYARVARTGVPIRVESFSRILKKYVELSAFRMDPDRPAVFFFDISERLKANKALRESERRALSLVETLRRSESTLAGLLDDKAVLLKEVHHRVKNNLQVIVSLMNIERGRLGVEGPADAVLARTQDRVLAIAEVHDALYRSAGFAAANFAVALRGLVHRLAVTYEAAARGIVVAVAEGELMLPLDYAVPCCLAMSELITNALNYAFPGEWSAEKRIDVQMDVTVAGRVVLGVQDTGVGVCVPLDDAESLGGLRLARMLADQLNGEFSVSSGSGTLVRFSFALP
jgi:PAS domain S-box-containing protein